MISPHHINKNTSRKEAVRLGVCSKGIACAPCNQGCMFGSGAFAADQINPAAEFLGVDPGTFKEKYTEPVMRFNTTLLRPKLIREKNKNLKSTGRCIFYQEGKGCTIYPVRPLECMVAHHDARGEDLHTWFTLHCFVNAADPVSIREWNAHLESGGHPLPGGSVEELVPDKETRERVLKYEILR